MGIPTDCHLGYGLMSLTFKATQTSDEQAFAAIKASIDGGCTMLNSGEFYGYPEPTLNLQLLNRFYTKYPEYISKTYLSVKGGLVNMQPVATEESLRKSVTNINTILGVKKMDLFEMARVDKSVSIEDTMQILLKLRDEGHFKDIGLSEVSAETINRAVKVAPIAAVEVEYSPFSLDIEHNGVLAACKEHNIPIPAYSPLGRGLLTGTIKKPEDLPEGDYRRTLDRFQPDVFQNNLVVAEKLEAIAKQKKVTPAQLVLAWIMQQWEGFYPIPGSSRPEGVQEALGALKVRFEDNELEELRRIVDSADIQGGRYNAHFEGALFG